MCPPIFNLKDGGSYRPNKTQKWLWKCWLDFWDEFATYEADRKGVLFMGDLVDGDRKYRSHQIVTRNPAEIVDLAIECLVPAMDKVNWAVFLKGTPSHVGKSGSLEEELASDFEGIAQKNGENNYAWDEFYGAVQSVVFFAKHHGKLGYMRHTKVNPLHRDAEQILGTFVERGEKVPQIVLKAHKHRRADTYDNHIIRVLQTPCFAGQEEYGHRVSDEPPDVGGYIFYCTKGNYQLVKKNYEFPKRRLWKS